MRNQLTAVFAAASIAASAQKLTPQVVALPVYAKELADVKKVAVVGCDVSEDLVVTWEIGKGTSQLRTRDLLSGSTMAVANVPFADASTFSRTDRKFQDLTIFGNNVFMFEETWDRKSASYQLKVHGYALPDLTALAPGPTLIALDFAKVTLAQEVALGSDAFALGGRVTGRIVKSDDGSRFAYFYDGMRTKDNHQLIVTRVFDAQFQPLSDQQQYVIAFESDMLATEDVVVDNDGVIHALMRAHFKDRPITNSKVNFGFEVFRFENGEQRSRPVSLPHGYSAITARMCTGTEGLRIAGFFVEPVATTDGTAGYFVVDHDPSLEGAGPVAMTEPLGFKLEHLVSNTQLLMRSDGGCYLTANEWFTHFQSPDVREVSISVIAIDRSLGREWMRHVPRDLHTAGYPDNCTPVVVNDELLVFFPDDIKNLDRYRAGDAPKRKDGGERVTLVGRFNKTGEPSYFQMDPMEYGFEQRSFLEPTGPSTFKWVDIQYGSAGTRGGWAAIVSFD